MSERAWAEVLDALESILEQQADAVCDGDMTAIDTFSPPADLGPLPAALAPRARMLLAEAAALETAVEVALGATGRELAVVRRSVHASPASSSPHFIDEKA
jgi:hypothetical protein